MSHPDPPDEAELRNVERARLQALVSGDLNRASVLHADESQLVNPAGESLSKDADLGMIASGDRGSINPSAYCFLKAGGAGTTRRC
jgi:hypothetical protein